MLSRPSAAEVGDYRKRVDDAVTRLVEAGDAALLARALPILELGVAHEEQHQELLLTDVLHAFSRNPVRAGVPRRADNAAPRAAGRRRRASSRSTAGSARDRRARRRRLRVRQRAPAPQDVGRAVRARRSPRHDARARRVRRRRRVSHAVALALGGLGLRPRERRDGAALRDESKRARRASSRSPASAPFARGAGHARELLRGGRHRALPRRAPCRPRRSGRRRGVAPGARQLRRRRDPARVRRPRGARRRRAPAFGDAWEWTRSSYEPYPGYAAPPARSASTTASSW